MHFDIVTIFPEFFAGPLDYGIVRRAREAGLADIRVHDLREHAHDRHRTVDDRPFGGGEGMVLKPEPLFEAVEALVGTPREKLSANTAIVLLSASGKLFRQAAVRRLAKLDRVILLCGRYEGVDERVGEHLATDEISIGDFVLSGGEIAAALVVDAVTRLLPGALGNEASAVQESFSGPSEQSAVESPEPGVQSPERSTGHGSLAAGHGILDCPHYTRPAEYRGWGVPEVLLGGNHEEIRRWRRRAALEKTLCNRPDLLAGAALTAEDRATLRELQSQAARS